MIVRGVAPTTPLNISGEEVFMRFGCRILSEEYLFPDALLSDELSFLFSPLLLRGKITTLFAPAGIGKSTFVYKVVQELLERQVVRRVLCIFSDADTTNDEFRVLVDKYYRTGDIADSRFIPVMPNPSFWRDFKKDSEAGSLKEQEIDLIIVDSLEQFFDLIGLDFHRSVGVLLGLFRRLAIQGISILLLHHTNKAGEFSGRSILINQSDVVYRLKRVGRFKWSASSYKHRGAKLLDGKIDFYAELTSEGVSISTDFVDDRLSYIVHLIIEILSEKGRLKQYEIVREVKARAKRENGNDFEIGTNKIREALAKYDGIYWRAERVAFNALEYELLEVNVQVRFREKCESEGKEERGTSARERDERKEELDLKAELLERVVKLCEEGSLSQEFPEELHMFGIRNLDELVEKADSLSVEELESYVSEIEGYFKLESIGDLGELEGLGSLGIP